jgi:hypothetical protein
MTLEEQIRDLASKNYSFTHAARELGIPRSRLKMMMGYMPDVVWADKHESIGWQEGQENKRPQAKELRVELARIGRQALREKHAHTVQGVRGTIPELCRHFGVTSAYAAWKRIKAGWSLDAAVTTPTISKFGRKAA